MKLTLTAAVEGGYGGFFSAMDIPELYRKEFEPLKTCDEPIMAMVTGDLICKEKVNVVIKARKDAAEILAKELTKIIISAMENNDTHNGYAKDI